MSPIPQRDNPNRGDGESDEISSMETPQVIIAAGSSEDDEDEEFENFQGYQPLPQEPDSEMEPVPSHDGDGNSGATASAVESSINIDNVLMHTMDSQAFENAPGGNIFDVQGDSQEDEINRLWNTPRPKETKQSLSIDEDQAEKIKAAMSGFVIPKASHPNWANFLPEDEWKSQVLQKVRTEKTKKKSDLENEVLFEANFDEPVPDGSASSSQPSCSGN